MSVVPAPWPAGALLPALGGLFALLAFAGVAWRPQGAQVHRLMLAGWLALGLLLAVLVLPGWSGEGLRFGFGPVLSLTVWLVLAVYALERHLLPLPGLRRALALLGAAAVLLAEAFPGTVQAAAGSAWAPLHWATGVAAYGLFGAALLHGALMQRAERLLRTGPQQAGAAPGVVAGLPLLKLEQLTFRFVAAGFLLLSLTLLLGLLGTAWRWDHKTVFTLLSWAVFAGLLLGRWRLGWRGRYALRWLRLGALLLLLAYAGSRFVLEVLLHRGLG